MIPPISIFIQFMVCLILIAAVVVLIKSYPRVMDLNQTRKIVNEYFSSINDVESGSQMLIFPQIQEIVEENICKRKQNDLETIILRQAQLTAFQNQINPHFLYNTLDSVRGDVISSGLGDTADMIEALSKFFRYSLSSSTTIITFKEELENVKNYMKIMEYRFGNRILLNSVFDPEKDILEYQLPKLTLQPLVENAIKYGLETRESGGAITIRFLQSDTHVSICVEDNGIGINPESLQEINSGIRNLNQPLASDFSEGSGVALRNISERIMLLFGRDYGIHINSIVGHGTEVKITLPPIQRQVN